MKRIYTRLLHTWPLWRVLLLFMVIPLLVLGVKSAGYTTAYGTTAMIVNMLLCSCFLLYRASLLLCWKRRPAPPEISGLATVSLPDEQSLRRILLQRGYRPNRANTYAERGTVRRIALAGLLASAALLMLVGSYDNLFQFSGVVMLGPGEPVPLNKPATYTVYTKGPLMRFSSLPYKLKGVERFFPDATFPFGAAQIRLLTLDNRTLWDDSLQALGKVHEYDGFRFSMHALEYDVWLILTTTDNHVLYTDWIHFYPLDKPVDGYSHRGRLKRDVLNDVDGTALFNQVNDGLKVELRYKKERITAELGEAPDHVRRIGNYILKNEGIGRWSQIRVMRTRHTPLMAFLGGMLVLAGGMAIVAPRRRVWLSQSEHDGILLRTDDSELSSGLQSQSPDRGGIQ